METVFNMYVNPRNVGHLEEAIKKINDNQQISIRENLAPHFVSYVIYKQDAVKVWFKITVSRPYLIFAIGEMYVLVSCQISDCNKR